VYRIAPKGGVLPHPGADPRLGEFQDDGSDTADEQGNGVLEHLPGDRVGG
jgi:hypothetical protein